MCPTTVASMLMRLAMFSKLDRPESIPVSGPEDRADAAKLLGWSTAQLETPLWTVAKDSFAAAFGPLVNNKQAPSFPPSLPANHQLCSPGQSQCPAKLARHCDRNPEYWNTARRPDERRSKPLSCCLKKTGLHWRGGRDCE
jgi:hypothetical protein